MLTNIRINTLNSILSALTAAMVFLLFSGCSKKDESAHAKASEKSVIQNAGSDTMVNLALAWAEAYRTIESSVSLEISGGGSGTGIAALINGTVDIANCSRQVTSAEMERANQNTGKNPHELIVGYDALAIYVHKDNPLDEITIEQLAEIYGEGASIQTWSELGIENSDCSNDEIIRVSRQSNSGTYFYFREAVLGRKRDFKLGSRDLHGSKDVVELVGSTPCAIGYSGMGYNTDHVKMLKVANQNLNATYAPNVENALSGAYPIARPLYMYSLGAPGAQVKKYIDWILSSTGQEIVAKTGYVPLPK